MSQTIIQKSLRFSFIEGICFSMMLGLSETFITPYALALGAGTALVGLLAALPSLAGALIQVTSADLAERLGSRKRLMTAAVFLQALVWIPIILIPYVAASHAPAWLIALYMIFTVFGSLALSPWSSLMADHVPDTARGKVFGFRNRVCGIVNVTMMLLAGLILSIIKSRFPMLPAITGFSIIFFIAFIARLESWHYLMKMYEAPHEIRNEHRFTMGDFLRRIRHSNFGRFVICTSLINFAVAMSGPFFAVYMLRDLKFTYLTYTLVTMASTLTIFFMMTLWGSHADHVGNRKVLRLTSCVLPFIPMLWLFSHNVAYLVAIQFFGGFFWAGFNLAVTNFMYDAVIPEKRTRCIAYFNVINGVGIFFGSLAGGFLAGSLPPIAGYRLLSLFLLSGLIRLGVAPLFSFIKEVRKVKHVSNLEFFYSIMTGRSASSMYEGR